MSEKLIILLLCFIAFSTSHCGIDQCQANNYEIYLGTKTPYRVVANLTYSKVSFEGCQPLKFWSMIRHGTRNPNIKLIEKMRTRLVEIRDLIIENVRRSTELIHNSDLAAFRRWKSPLEEGDEKKLTHHGEEEMLALAERMQSRFPELLDNIYSPDNAYFRFTATQRTRKSAEYYAIGLYGKKAARTYVEYPKPLENDPVLRFYKLCNKWRQNVSKNPQSLIERRKFESGPFVYDTVKKINQRLGLQSELDLVDVHAMYTVCGFETAWDAKKRSPWCSPFTIRDFKIMEYIEDLKYYWIDGYGYELTYMQACPAIQDMLEFFSKKNPRPKATMYFSHSGTLLKIIAHLGLYRDAKHLVAEDFPLNTDRQWKVSQIDSFGSNLALILYDCGISGKKVLTLHQEKMIRLPCCADDETDLCDLEKIKKYYNASFPVCHFSEMCGNYHF